MGVSKALVLSLCQIRIGLHPFMIFIAGLSRKFVTLLVGDLGGEIVYHQSEDETPKAHNTRDAALRVTWRVLFLPKLRADNATYAVEDEKHSAHNRLLGVAFDIRSHQANNLSKRRRCTPREPRACYDAPAEVSWQNHEKQAPQHGHGGKKYTEEASRVTEETRS